MTTTRSSQHSEPRQYTSSDHLVLRSSDRHLTEEDNVVKTNERLNRVLKIELAKSVEENSGLISDVFPDEALPFKVDEELLLNFTPEGTRSNHKDELKHNTIIGHPNMASEETMAKWLNDIGEMLRHLHPGAGEYTGVNGEPVAPPKRVWRSQYSKNRLGGSDYSLKPDLILVDEESGQHDSNWPAVQVLGEVTQTEMKRSRTIKETVHNKSFLMFTTQANRVFSIAIMFTGGNSFTLNVCDRSGSVRSKTLVISQHPVDLLRVIVGCVFARPGVLGRDETIKCIKGKADEISLGCAKYKVMEELFSSEALRGRATKCWRARKIGEDGNLEGENVAIKDSWADTRRAQNEIKILKAITMTKLYEEFCLPKFVDSWDVPSFCSRSLRPFPGSTPTSSRRRKHSTVEGRAHRRLVTTPVGKKLVAFGSIKELLQCMIATVKGNLIFHMALIYTNICNST